MRRGLAERAPVPIVRVCVGASVGAVVGPNLNAGSPRPACRYHSLYPWHKEGEYEWLEDDLDREMKPWVQLFNKYDLYTKADVKLDEQLMRARYAPIVEKFAPHALMW